ncbi:MAG: hypothetical protein ACYC2E_04110 [Sulfuricella sp.]
MTNPEFLHELHIPLNKKYFLLSEVPELTSLAVHPQLEGELCLEDALSAQSVDPDDDFSNQPTSPQNIILKRLTDTQTHKAFLEKQINNGSVLAYDHRSSIPLKCVPEDMPKQKALFKFYALQRSELIKFANSLNIDVIIDDGEALTTLPISPTEVTAMRNAQMQAAAEQFAQDFIATNKRKPTRRRIAGLLSQTQSFSDVTAETIERILRVTW